jgi:hypothetical protein
MRVCLAAANLRMTLECHSMMMLGDVSEDDKKNFVSFFRVMS